MSEKALLEVDGVVFEVEIGRPIAADPDWFPGKRPRLRLTEGGECIDGED